MASVSAADEALSSGTAHIEPLAQSAQTAQAQLSLADVQSMVLKRNRDVLRARLEVSKGEAALKAVQATQYPSINVFAFEGAQAAPRSGNNLAVLPGVFQPVTQLYRIRLQVHQAQIALNVARQQLRLSKQNAIAEAKKIYLKTVSLQSAVISRQENLAFLRTLVGYVTAEVKRGAILQVELLTAEAREAQAEYELERDSDDLITAHQSLNRLLDRPLQTEITAIEEPFAPKSEQSAEAVMTQAVIRRPEVTNLKLNASKFRLEEKVALSRYIPDLSVGSTA
ncbi:MAG: TolC family protein, partial [Cyanobacteria bacterium REEB67]|nr:TolC family protein [Cyanobacteria bacterium REEB67]